MYFLIFWGEQPNTSLLLTVYGYIPNKKEEGEVSVQIFPLFVLESSATRHTCIRPRIIFDGKYCTCVCRRCVVALRKLSHDIAGYIAIVPSESTQSQWKYLVQVPSGSIQW